MNIELLNVKPSYMSEDEVRSSGIYMQESVKIEASKKHLIKANSGHGKTSVLNIIYGSSLNYDGELRYDGKTIDSEAVFSLRKDTLSYVFQDFKLFEELTAFENILLKNKLTNYKTEQEIDALITRVGLSHRKDSLVKTMSLGQRQRIAIIRALCQPFEFILLDEPFSHLDTNNIEILTQIINEELKQRNAGLLLTALGDCSYFDFDTILNL